MRFLKPQFVLAIGLALLAAAIMALAMTPSVTLGLEVTLMILIGAAMVSMYFVRHSVRAELVYRRHVDRGRPPPVLDPDLARNRDSGRSR